MALLDATYILAAVRSLLNEYSTVVWTDDQLNKWIQEAAMDISIKTLGYEDSDVIETVANVLESDEPDGTIKVHSCVKGGAPIGWTAYLDNTYWQDLPGGGLTTWESTYWNVLWWLTHAWGDIEEIGTWASGFRPTKFRVTFECSGGITEFELYLQTVDDDVICEDLAYTSGTELDCDFSAGKDIDYFSHTFPEAAEYTAHITNIEFYGAGTTDTDHKGLSRIHPRLIQHVAHNETGEPIHYYHHHGKIGIWPLPDDAYAVTAYSSKVTETITDLPSELRLLAIPYCLAMARLSEGWEDDFEMFITMYLNSVMAHRPDRGQYKLNTIDSKDKFQIPQGKVVNG